MSSDDILKSSLNKSARLRMEEAKKKNISPKGRKPSIPRSNKVTTGPASSRPRSGVRSRSISRNKPATLKTTRKARIITKKKKGKDKESESKKKKTKKRKKKSGSSSEESEEEESDSGESSASSSTSSEE